MFFSTHPFPILRRLDVAHVVKDSLHVVQPITKWKSDFHAFLLPYYCFHEVADIHVHEFLSGSHTWNIIIHFFPRYDIHYELLLCHSRRDLVYQQPRFFSAGRLKAEMSSNNAGNAPPPWRLHIRFMPSVWLDMETSTWRPKRIFIKSPGCKKSPLNNLYSAQRQTLAMQTTHSVDHVYFIQNARGGYKTTTVLHCVCNHIVIISSMTSVCLHREFGSVIFIPASSPVGNIVGEDSYSPLFIVL